LFAQAAEILRLPQYIYVEEVDMSVSGAGELVSYDGSALFCAVVAAVFLDLGQRKMQKLWDNTFYPLLKRLRADEHVDVVANVWDAAPAVFIRSDGRKPFQRRERVEGENVVVKEVIREVIKEVVVEKEVPVEVIKRVEIIKEVPVEVIREKRVEIIKEVPVEVIREVEVTRYEDEDGEPLELDEEAKETLKVLDTAVYDKEFDVGETFDLDEGDELEFVNPMDSEEEQYVCRFAPWDESNAKYELRTGKIAMNKKLGQVVLFYKRLSQEAVDDFVKRRGISPECAFIYRLNTKRLPLTFASGRQCQVAWKKVRYKMYHCLRASDHDATDAYIMLKPLAVLSLCGEKGEEVVKVSKALGFTSYETKLGFEIQMDHLVARKKRPT